MDERRGASVTGWRTAGRSARRLTRDRVVLGLRQVESAEAKGGRLCAGMLLPACARRDVRHIVKPRSARHLRLAGARRLH